ncbi:uncharacterized protein A4U43_UnF10130 [Asparagus officinalis]|uniref:Uncharacterized protein n=1 Tax=Asparagus officinalis TaxID=4686 RepID=A0A1R3L5I8_ASPOF|nr:uncharacterized protein A4U43_UnF10130 [Asparagus officinalis]
MLLPQNFQTDLFPQISVDRSSSSSPSSSISVDLCDLSSSKGYKSLSFSYSSLLVRSRPPHHSPSASSHMLNFLARRIDNLEEGVYGCLNDLERRQEEIRVKMIGGVDGLGRQLSDILNLLQPSTPSPGPGLSSS